jgi:hypothetical protein
MLPRRTFLALILVSALLTAGCGEIVMSFGDLLAVQNALTKKFGEEVSVTANAGPNGTMVVVWFVNSPLNDDSAEQRVLRATEAADVVKNSYSRIQNVREIWIGFVRKKTRLVVFHHSEIVAVHGFDKNGTALPGRNEKRYQPPEDVQVNASYDSSNKVSDISASGIQLEGRPGGLGVTVLPFFKLKGYARGDVKLPPPKTVDFNFASYAEKPRFKQTVPITFVADNKVILKTEGDFNGNDAQFCYLTIPYPAFRRMVNGQELIIKLGEKEYPLTPSQLAAMRGMTTYVTE